MTADSAPQDTLNAVAQGDAPVLERLVAMNLDSLASSGLDDKQYFLVRLAALVAMDAAPVSYLVNLGLAADAGVTIEEAQGVLIAISPMVGSARVASAAGKILRAFGFAVAAEEDAEEEI
ncbi:carboxymuconolactone decarboxylase family protein [Saccharomonospora sp. NPDC046836]|uniref:carboxymuconolactone decarboxylase family protein n=1 Tax=Saccharomonospora sp. NPDC046836 TaxID=3156921 RepID=UPI0033EC7055